MEIIYSEIAQEDIIYWRKSGTKGIQKKIQSLIEDIKTEVKITQRLSDEPF